MTATENTAPATTDAQAEIAALVAITEDDRAEAARWARPHTQRFWAERGIYHVTVGGYVVGEARRVAATGRITWVAVGEGGVEAGAEHRTRRAAAEALARTDAGVAAYREAAREGVFGTEVERYETRRAEAVRAAAEREDDEPSAEDVLGACVVDEPGADLPEGTDAGFGYGLTPTDLPEAAEIVAYLADAGMSAGIDEQHGVVAYTTNPANLASALDGTGWAAVALTLGGMTVPGMYAVERTFALPPAPVRLTCPDCLTVTGSGCATCRPDSVLGG